MSPTARPCVLVVNDDPASLLALGSLLEQWSDTEGYDIVTAASGEDALRHVLRREFAVILMDVNMPGMDGFETAEAIRAHPRLTDVPIIFVTAFQIDEVSRVRAYQYSAADFLFTPVIPQILRAKVSVFVALALKNQQLRAQGEELGRQTEALLASNARLLAEMREREAAERDNDAKDDFLAMLSHELRNPLSALSTAARLLGMPGVPDQTTERARTVIQRQTRQLRRIVDDILDLSRLTSGKVVLNREPADICSVVRKCLDDLAAAGRTRSHRLSLDLTSAWAQADQVRFGQVVTHLVDNAVAFTPAGGEIHVTTRTDEDEAVLCVRDSGIGMTADLLPHIFDVFVQGPRKLDRSEGGLGIGLAVVKALVDLHDGEVAAYSDGPDRGSTVEVRLASIPVPR